MDRLTRERNFKLTMEYDGSAYHGWQRQAGDRTIQGEIEGALATVTRQPVTLNGSGRTDAGVHALGQTASFRCRTRLAPAVFQRALNSMLDGDIVITACAEMPLDFHARFDVVDKTYHYRLLNRPLPSALMRRYAWHIRQPLDLDAMSAAAALLLGAHDFKSFEAAGSPRAHTVRIIYDSRFTRHEEGRITYTIRANGFLRYMVRNIVGTLVEVGRGLRAAESIPGLLDQRDRRLAAATAPANGLFLAAVSYPS